MSESWSIAAAKRCASAGASISGSRLASRVALVIASRLVIATSRVPNLAAITSPCSVMRMRPCTVPAGCARIAAKLLPLRDDTVVLPGHGPATTIGRERASNPFLQGLTGTETPGERKGRYGL